MAVRQRPCPQALRLSVSAGAVFSSNFHDGAPSIDHEATGAKGFLSFVESPGSEERTPSVSPHAQFVKEFWQLRFLFPEFPAPMIKSQLLQERGRGQVVYQHMVSRGWTPSRHMRSKRGLLSMTTNPLFHIPYYWGCWRPEYSKILAKQKPGSFLTAYRPQERVTEIQFFVWVVDHKKRVRKWACPSPLLTSAQLNIYSLRHELARPSDIPLSALIRLETTLSPTRSR